MSLNGSVLRIVEGAVTNVVNLSALIGDGSDGNELIHNIQLTGSTLQISEGESQA